jgi:CheY-like chemotaxis protein
LGVSRRAALSPVPTDLSELVAELAALMRRVLPATIAIETVTDPGAPPVRADPSAVQQIVLNLLTNARDAMPDGGAVRVGVRRVENVVCLSVADSGIGMDDYVKAHLFEPFFTTKPVGKGTGLGMAMVHGLVLQHEGWIRVDSAPGRGTAVHVGLPIAVTERAAASRGAPSDLKGGNETIVVVDDEAALRRSAGKLLERLGYRVLTAQDGLEALELCRAQDWRVDLVVADGQMPGLTGTELHEALRREAPGIRFLLASGYRMSDGEIAPGVATIPFLAKPWTLAELAGRVREVLDVA